MAQGGLNVGAAVLSATRLFSQQFEQKPAMRFLPRVTSPSYNGETFNLEASVQIFADDNMPLVPEFFSELGTIHRFSGRQLDPSLLAEAEVLLVRSITKVDTNLLAQAPRLRFIGTATIGTDHLDIAAIEQRGIHWTNAAGCNAQSVVEYVLSCLFLEAERRNCLLSSLTVGVVGIGQIGRRLVRALMALQVKVVQCDPPRFEQDASFPHVPFELLCQQVDIISLHVPLHDGPHGTWHLLSRHGLAQLPVDVTIINACRGEVVDNQALLDEQLSGKLRALYLDVWEGEPHVLEPLIPFTQIATAHIAGHSIEGKARGTEMLYQAWCQLQQLPATKQLEQLLPPVAWGALQLTETFKVTELSALCRMLYDVRRDDRIFRQQLMSHGFDALRKHYPARREFSALTLTGVVPHWLEMLGFANRREPI